MADITDDPLHEFKNFVQQAGFWGKLAVVTPLAIPPVPTAIAFFSSGPLWPDGSVLISGLISLACYIAEVIIYTWWFRKHGEAKDRFSKRCWWFGGFSFILLIAFVVFIYFFNYPPSGVGYTPRAQAYAARHPEKNVFEILHDHGNQEGIVFSEGYLAGMRLGGLLLWFALFTVLTNYFTVFVILQRKKQTEHAARHHAANPPQMPPVAPKQP